MSQKERSAKSAILRSFQKIITPPHNFILQTNSLTATFQHPQNSLSSRRGNKSIIVRLVLITFYDKNSPACPDSRSVWRPYSMSIDLKTLQSVPESTLQTLWSLSLLPSDSHIRASDKNMKLKDAVALCIKKYPLKRSRSRIPIKKMISSRVYDRYHKQKS